MRELPYRPDEQRVVDYFKEIIPDVGAGEDPIGFLIASHRVLIRERQVMLAKLSKFPGMP